MIFEKRENYKPFDYDHITLPLIEAMLVGHWTYLEFDFMSDVQDFHVKLNDQEREVIKRAILMISQIEVAVKSYWSNIGKLLPVPEIAEMGSVFGGVEVIHARSYSKILDKLGFNDEYQNILTVPAIRGRVAYLNKYNDKPYRTTKIIYADLFSKLGKLTGLKYFNKISQNLYSKKFLADKKNIVYSLTLFTLFVENVSLFSQFYLILSFHRNKNILKDIANVVQYTSKEENLHAEGGIALINQIRKEHPEIFDAEFEERIVQETKEALLAETNLVEWILNGYSNEFINKDILITYLKRRLNESTSKIGFGSMFEVDSEMVEKTIWMDEEVFATSLTDFFYKKPIDYQKKTQSFDANELF